MLTFKHAVLIMLIRTQQFFSFNPVLRVIFSSSSVMHE
jgi:hypothetical protein